MFHKAIWNYWVCRNFNRNYVQPFFRLSIELRQELRWCYTSRFLTKIFNADILYPWYTRELLTQLCWGNGMYGMLHETILTQHCSQHLNPGSCSTHMACNELRRRRLKIIQVLLFVDDLEGRHRFLLIELYDLPASSNRASGIVISTGPSSSSSSTSSAILFVYFTSTWPIFGSPRCILGRCCVKSQPPGCYTHQHQQNSGDNVAGFLIAFKNLQHVALKIALCTLLHEATFNTTNWMLR